MLNTIAIMNTKGGVGKSTIVMALAETLSAFYGKTVLVVDSDAQASVSSMLMSVPQLYELQARGETMVEYLVAGVLHGHPVDWTRFVVEKVSDVDDARSVYLIPSDMQLTLFEREVSKGNHHARLRSTIADLVRSVSSVFDIVLIDCPPGLSVLTESWLREAHFHISPTKADYVSVCGLEVFRRFKALNPEMGFAENLGVLVNLKEMGSDSDAGYHVWLKDNPENRCFRQAIPRLGALQDAARHQALERSFAAKYPGAVGIAVKALAEEFLERLATANADHVARSSAATTPAATSPSPVMAAAAQRSPVASPAPQTPAPVEPAPVSAAAPEVTDADAGSTPASRIPGVVAPELFPAAAAEPPAAIGADAPAAASQDDRPSAA